jgi:hypothetical protein
MERKIKIAIMSAAAGILALGIIVSAYLSPPSAEAEELCQTVEQAAARTEGKMEVKAPGYLPEGYRPICADGSPDVLLLFYGTGEPLDREQVNRVELVDSGAILVASKRFGSESDDAYYEKDRRAEIERMFNGENPDVKTGLTVINGNLAAVREECKGCGKSFVTHEDGTTVQVGTFSLPSAIVYYDGDQQYRIEGYVPLAELEKIAQSLR